MDFVSPKRAAVTEPWAMNCTLTSDSTGLKKRSTRSTAIVREFANCHFAKINLGQRGVLDEAAA